MKLGRRKAREDALQILYQLDLNRDLDPHNGLARFESCFTRDAGPTDAFTQRLVYGVREHLTSLDAQVEEVSEHWRTDRMAIVDRNILRLGCFELGHCDDIPATVSINEMIELAKEFGSENSPSFINGVLDKVKDRLDRPAKAN